MTRRVPVLVVLVALVAGGLLADRAIDDAGVVAPVAPVVDAAAFPMATPESARSSTWFCAGGTADEEAFAHHVITMLNPTARSMVVTLTAFGGQVESPPADTDLDALDPDADADADPGDSSDAEPDAPDDGTTDAVAAASNSPVVRDIEIPAHQRARLQLSDLLTAPIASALVEAPAGGLVVEHEVRSVHGLDAKPCATRASDTWHFAWGTTIREARELLVLFNPFADDAIVDGRFSTEDGVREPVRFDGLVVPARSTIGIDLGDDVTRRTEVAATLTTRSGRIVVDRIIRQNGGGARGLTVQTGVPRGQTDWVFPDGFSSDTVQERFVIYNPTDDQAEVGIELLLERPEENGVPEPIDLGIAPRSHVTIDLTADGRIPDGVAHAAVVRSENGVPVVAEQVIVMENDDRRGMTAVTGSPVEAETWHFAAGTASAIADLWIVVVNLDPVVLAEIDVFAVAGGQLLPISGLEGLVVEAGERVALRIGERIQRDDLPIIVRSTEPIVAERGLYGVGKDRRGAANSLGVPVDGTWRTPNDPLDVEVDADLGDLGDLEGLDGSDVDDGPRPPDDVDLPEPDQTIVIDDPDAEATVPSSSTSTTEPPPDGVPDTTPVERDPAATEGPDG